MEYAEVLGRQLWETSQRSQSQPNSRDWWLEIAKCAMDLMSMDTATAVVQQELGGVEVSDQKPDLPASEPEPEPTAHETLPEGSGPRTAAHRVGCSRRAQTERPYPLSREFAPSKVGYSVDDLRRDYPHLEPASVLESFLSHHIAKGDMSKNWLEMFFRYCLNGERMAKERAADKTSTDSMGQPLDPSERARRLRVAREHERENNEFIDQQIEKESNHER